MPRRPPEDFVQAVLDCLDITPTELGRRLGKGTAYQSVKRWLDGHAPGYEDTMEMLDMCGWLRLPQAADPIPDEAFSTALLGRIVSLLEREPQLHRVRPDLLRSLAAEMKEAARRLEAAAEDQGASQSL